MRRPVGGAAFASATIARIPSESYMLPEKVRQP